jgi:hypothetical protein
VSLAAPSEGSVAALNKFRRVGKHRCLLFPDFIMEDNNDKYPGRIQRLEGSKTKYR